MKTIILALAFTAFAFGANAQTTASANQTITLTLQNQIDISISGTPSGTSFTFGSVADYSAGLTNTSASTFAVKSNQGWAVTVKAAAANFTSSAATAMPASVLGVRLNGGSSFTSLSTTAASFTSGSRGSSSFTVDYNANPGFSYDAGSYTLNVVYTATQQ
jgi:hypothetical protein